MLLALDDTDTRQGGCTTHTAFRIAVALDAATGVLDDWRLVAPPRLVRLSPAIREKTRGNGALVLPIGPAHAGGQVIGTTPEGGALRLGRPQTAPAPEDMDDVVRALRALVERHLPAASEDGLDPSPGAILIPGPTEETLYRAAVHRRVSREEAFAAARGTVWPLTPQPRRGEIGALAAAAWRPTPRGSTWEAIAYRDPAKPRVVPSDFETIAYSIPGGFDNIDPDSGRVRAVPRTPCPVRFGLRGLDPQALLRAAALVWSDADGTGGWLLQTNHARGDHQSFAEGVLAPERVVRGVATIVDRPQRRRGGHAFARAVFGSGSAVTLAAYEPTKSLRDVFGRLVPGDRVHVLARTSEDPFVLALEAFHVLDVAPRTRPGPNPRCPHCDVAAKSRGKDAGFRCAKCGTRLPAEARSERPMDEPLLRVGDRHQVPDHVRGHLLPPRGGVVAALPLTPEEDSRTPRTRPGDEKAEGEDVEEKEKMRGDAAARVPA